MSKIRPIAIYLPQFHPIPENDIWWGKGFTEWANVVRAKPRFKGHYQPHLPADLGFYDLRLEETRLAQEELAKSNGFYGFCYYHYWFSGKKVLHEVLDKKLNNPKEDFPFMVCWANENWTRAWDGMEKEVLLKQDYSEEDDIQHMEYLCNTFFKDERYIKHEGKPVFLIYRPKLFLDINKTIKVWRKVAKDNGIEALHIGYMQSWGVKEPATTLGFDFAVEFQPNFPSIKKDEKSFFEKIKSKIRNLIGIKIKKGLGDRIFDYKKFTEIEMSKTFNKEVCPSIVPSWDNSSRRKENAFIFSDANPTDYGNWLKHIKLNYPWNENKENFLFINAWNEWAEGNHLEPCQKWGTSYLEVTKTILKKNENGK